MDENNIFTIFIEKEWLNGNTCLFTIKNTFEYLYAKNEISKKRKIFVETLKNEGFNITYNKEDIDENTICLIMDNTALCGKDISIDVYKKLFDQKIFESAGDYFNYPFSLPLKDYLNNPFFPAVFKNELTNGGQDKFLIETSKQVEIIRKFYHNYYNISDYNDAFNCTICQQFLKNPGKYATYLRVLVAGSGDIMGASLKYAIRTANNTHLAGFFEKNLLNPQSEYFINAQKMFNYYSGGENITFSQPKYSSEKTSILAEHGFDLANLSLPISVLEVCKNIMEKCNRELGIMCGIDFMLNQFDGKWYYLENQAFPAIEEWAWVKGIKIPQTQNIKGYLNYLELDLQARYEALHLLANKKRNTIKVLK